MKPFHKIGPAERRGAGSDLTLPNSTTRDTSTGLARRVSDAPDT